MKKKERSRCETRNIYEGVEDKKRARAIHSGGWWIVLFFWISRLSIYSLLMNQVWLFLFLPRPRARLLLWAGRFLSVPPRLHPGIERKRERRKEGREREMLSRYVRPVSTATLSRAPEFFSPSLSSWFDVNWNTEGSDGTDTLSREVSDASKHTYQSLTLHFSGANTLSRGIELSLASGTPFVITLIAIINMIFGYHFEYKIFDIHTHTYTSWKYLYIELCIGKRIPSRSGFTMWIASIERE